MKRMMMLAVLALLATAARAEAQGFTVIVNEANAASSLTKDELSKIFLKKTTKWTAGGAIAAVDLPTDAAAREAFSKAVHDRGTGAIQSYWQQQIFSGKDVPPPEKASDAEVIAFVKSHPNAIGYVSAGASLAGVKALKIK